MRKQKRHCVYVVTMYRYGDREAHSYVLGVFRKKHRALMEERDEEAYRGGKYDGEVLEIMLDSKETKVIKAPVDKWKQWNDEMKGD